MKILRYIIIILIAYIAITSFAARMFIYYIDNDVNFIQSYIAKIDKSNIVVKKVKTNWGGLYPSIEIKILDKDIKRNFQYPEKIKAHLDIYKTIFLFKPVIKSVYLKNIRLEENIFNILALIKTKKSSSSFLIDNIHIEDSNFIIKYKENIFDLQKSNITIGKNHIYLQASLDSDKDFFLAAENIKIENSNLKYLNYKIKIDGIFNYNFRNLFRENNIEIINSGLSIKSSGAIKDNNLLNGKFEINTKTKSDIIINKKLIKNLNTKFILSKNDDDALIFEINEYASNAKSGNLYKFSDISGSFTKENSFIFYANKINIDTDNLFKDFNIKISDFSFSGVAKSLYLKLYDINDISNFFLKGNFSKTNIFVNKNYIKNFSGYVESSKNNLFINFFSNDIKFSFKEVVRKDLFFKLFDGKISIEDFNNPIITFNQVVLKNDEIDINLSGFVDKKEDRIKVVSSINFVDMRYITNYFPNSFISLESSNYFNSAFTKGYSRDAKIFINGSISDFPFYDSLYGLSYAVFPINNLDVDYKKGWLPFENIKGTAYFKNRSAKFISNDISILQTKLISPTLNIYDVQNTELLIKGNLKGPFRDLLIFSNRAGLSNINSNTIQAINGNAETGFFMNLPFNGKKNIVKSEVKLQNLSYNLDDKNQFKEINGKIYYDNRKFYTNDDDYIKGFYNNNEIKFKLKSDKDDNFIISGTQILNINDYIDASNIKDYIAGNSSWKYNIIIPGFNSNEDKILIKAVSDLRGTIVDYPSPFKKKKNTESDIQISASFKKTAFENIEIKYNNIYSEIKTLKPLNGYINFSGEKNIIPKNGFDIYGALNFIDLKDWKKINKNSKQDNILSFINKIDITFSKFVNDNIVLDNFYINGNSNNSSFVFNEISVKNKKININANGNIEYNNISNFKINATGENLQELLNYWGIDHSIRDSSILSSFDISWQGGLFDYSIEKVYGKFSIKMKDGRLKKVGSRASRIFGLFNIDLLSKRLSLDFDDVTKNGFYFNSLDGDFRIDYGDIFTTNLLIKGPSAEMLAVGTTDIINETYDMQVVASPEFGEALPAIALLGGPITAAATFAAEKLAKAFGKDINDLIKIKYNVTGTWDDPIIKIIKKKSSALDAIEELFE